MILSMLLNKHFLAFPAARSIAIADAARLVRRSVALALLTTSICTHAQSQINEDSGDTDKRWQEVDVQVPPAPKPENLLPFYVSPTATQTFAIDAKSITVGSDGVIRYALVTTSTGGARNVSYEGIRCATYESRMYAFGEADGSWIRARHSNWQQIHGYAANRPQEALAKDYFCRELTVAGSAKEMVDRIRNKRTLAPQQDLQ